MINYMLIHSSELGRLYKYIPQGTIEVCACCIFVILYIMLLLRRFYFFALDCDDVHLCAYVNLVDTFTDLDKVDMYMYTRVKIILL